MRSISFIIFFMLTQVFLLAQERTNYKIGVLAKRGTEKTLERWQPTAAYLSKELAPLSFEIVPLDFDEIFTSVENHSVDFILANSSYYVALEMQYGVSRIATMENLLSAKRSATHFGGVIFTRSDNTKIHTLEDLKGKRFGAVDPLSFGGWHMAWYELHRVGIDPFSDFQSMTFQGTHDNVVYAVLNRTIDAGTVRTDTIERMVAEGKIKLQDFQVIHPKKFKDFPLLISTRLYPEWPFAKINTVDNKLAEKVAIALMKMSPDSAAAKTGQIAGWTIPLDYQSIHECLKAIKVGPYKDYGKITLQDVFILYWYVILGILLFIIGIILTALYISRLNKELKGKQARIVKLNSELQIDIKKQKELLDSVTNSINDLIFYKDTEFNYIGCNKAFEEYTGRPAAEIVGKSDFDIFDRETAEFFRSMDIQMFKKGVASANNEWVVYPDGSQHYLHTVKSPLLREDGTLIGLVGIARDTTDFKQMNDELESYKNSLEVRVKEEIDRRREKEELLAHQSKQVAMGEMIENIAHQWRQPINALGLLIQDINDAFKYNELDKAYMDKTTKTAMTIVNKMSQTIDDFRNFFKKEKEQTEFYLKDVVDEALVITGSALKNNKIDVQLIENKRAKAYGFANEYSQVVMNILNNAKDALKKHQTGKREITIEIDETDDGRSQLTITDNDGGIDPAIIDRIFEAHFTTKTSDEGTGIGLYMSQVIIEKHMGGKILAANAKESGASFTIIL